ncbi:MAG TPA: hypothetical protein P5169_08605, partial [Kiritimatiellia bacterium]|nr:hypothetical protein [Kiritimatiellia bacterium]
MKRIILTCLAAGLLGLAGLGEEAGTHVQFDFYNAALAPQGARGLAVFPELIDAANPLGLTTHDRIYRSTSAGGSVVISNLVWGDYRVEFYGPTITTTNWFSVPATNTGALLNVTNLIRQAHAWQGRHAATYGPWNLLPGSNVVFSTGPGVTYVNATGDGGWTEATTATGWKLVEPEYAGGTNTFAPVYQLT